MFALIDCNNFYASCELIFRPEIAHLPVVVLSNQDGCVIARNAVAKSLDIKMGDVYFQKQDYFKLYNVQVFSSNYTLYGDISHRIMTIISSYCKDIEVYSVDEAFIDLSGQINPNQLMEELKLYIRQTTQVNVSIGIASTKVLAKAANKIAKTYPEQTKGIYNIDSEEKRLKCLKWLKISDVWGIGSQYARKLNREQIFKAIDYVNANNEYIKKHFSVVGLRLKYELEGKSVLKLEDVKAKKSIAVTRSFDKNLTDFSQLKERVSTFASICSEKLRKQKSSCSAILVFIHTNYFRKDLPRYSKSIIIPLSEPNSSVIEITKATHEGLKLIYKKGYAYKKAGVIALDLCDENVIQHNIFEEINNRAKQNALCLTLDKLNGKYGDKVRLASQDFGEKWKMKQNFASPNYTTKWNEILAVE